EYAFKGDAVVENSSLAAVFWSAKGRVVLYSKAEAAPANSASSGPRGLGKKILEFVPLRTKTQSGKLESVEILRNAGDEVALEVSFSAKGSTDGSVVFSFGRNEIVEIKPAAKMNGMSLLSSVEYGVVPGFVGDDLIFGPAEFASAETLCVPADNL